MKTTSEISNDIDDIEIKNPFNNFSLYDYLFEETVATDVERESSIYKNREKRIYTFLSIPKRLESFILYGFLISMDHLLWLFTFLIIRCLLCPFRVIRRLFSSKSTSLFCVEEIEDLVKLSFLLIITFFICFADTSIIYHQIRSQSVIKLYIFYNLLEVADRLLSPLCQDILDALSWTIGEPSRKIRHKVCNFLGQYLFALFSFTIHLLVMISQVTILNVAFNSHSNALLTVMLSNNFVELKGNVFRKVEKTNLFQMSCADARERFHYVIMLTLIVFRNIREIGWNYDYAVQLLELFSYILIAEILVDWVKHAFVTKFNFMSAEVYRDFAVSLAYDFILCRKGKTTSSYFELMSRRMGLTSIPLACLVNLFLLKILRGWNERIILVGILVGMFLLKIGINLLLLKMSYNEVNNYLNSRTSETTQDTTVSQPATLLTTRGSSEPNLVTACGTTAVNFEQERTSSHSTVSDAEQKVRRRRSCQTVRMQNDYDILLQSLEALSRRHIGGLKRNNSVPEVFPLPGCGDISEKSSVSDISALPNTVVGSVIGDRTPTKKKNLAENKGHNLEEEILETSISSDDIRRRRRTISCLTEDLSDGSMEPLIHSGEEAKGVVGDINDGSVGASVVVESNSISVAHNSDSDGDSEISPTTTLTIGCTGCPIGLVDGTNNSSGNGKSEIHNISGVLITGTSGLTLSQDNNSNSEIRSQPFSDVNRFSMYSNQIV